MFYQKQTNMAETFFSEIIRLFLFVFYFISDLLKEKNS